MKKILIATIAALGISSGVFAGQIARTFTPTRFNVEIRGQGPDVILIPGLGCSRDVWSAQAARLAATHRLHLVQINGFAGAPAPASTDAFLASTVEELHRYIEVNGFQSPAVIGHSMGGLMGLMLASGHPESVRRLMIVDSFPFYGVLFDPTATPADVEPYAADMRGKLIAMSDADFAAQQQAGVKRLVLTPEHRQEVVDWGVASDRATFAQAMYEVMTTDMRPKVSSVATPITVLYPYAAAMGLQADTDALYKGAYASAPNARLVRINNSFHFIMLDQPVEFQNAVETFLNDGVR